MMILRNPETNRGDTSSNFDNGNELLSQWCPEGVKNSLELDSLKNLMQPPILKYGKDCPLCGKWFGSKSLPIHQSSCRKKPHLSFF